MEDLLNLDFGNLGSLTLLINLPRNFGILTTIFILTPKQNIEAFYNIQYPSVS